MDRKIPALPFAASMFVGMMLCIEIGRRLGMRSLAKYPERDTAGLGPMQGAVYGLFSLLIAFTFSGAPSRLDHRRALIAEEANTIGTAWLRLDLLPTDAQPPIRELFRQYLDSRLAAYRKLPDINAAKAELAKSETLQNQIWSQALAAARMPGAHGDAMKLVVPSLNQMIDITTTRTMAMRIHPPAIIFYLLFTLALVCSLMAGYGMSGRRQGSRLHTTAFVTITAICVFVILEIEYPRAGFFRMDAFDQVLVELRQSMN
jgi:hypothetical protein